jgi:hypothetical protein
MEIKKRTETISSVVNDLEQDVLLTITFGNAQIGGNILIWDGLVHDKKHISFKINKISVNKLG